jgi:hypothetical protein
MNRIGMGRTGCQYRHQTWDEYIMVDVPTNVAVSEEPVAGRGSGR